MGTLSIQETTEANFDHQVLEGGIVLVDFWAEWCGPCKRMLPILEEVAELYQDRIKFVKLNVDEGTNIAAKYGIRGIPTLILFKQGEAMARQTGSLGKQELIDFLEENL